MTQTFHPIAFALLAATVLNGCGGGGDEVGSLSFTPPAMGLAVSGTPRLATLSNTGALPIAQLTLAPEGLPAGTTLIHNCPDRLEPQASCRLMLLPGDQPSAAPGDAAARPATVRVSSASAPMAALLVSVITHGSVYQGGFVFAIDDSTPIGGSIGGKVAGLSDLPGQHHWSPALGAAGVGGLDVAGPNSCDGATDGACNTARIVALHGSGTYAAALCTDSTEGGHSDWYLPTLCELGYDLTIAPENFCGTGQQPRLADNIRSNLIDLQSPVGNFDANLRWSSNERAADPDLWALASSTTTQNAFAGGQKVLAERLVRCVRPLTP
ncbi:MAG: hypothetical protein C0449_01325 [Polaromonas sp.]|nr:hypothetical protein [Polaromonas sp.]